MIWIHGDILQIRRLNALISLRFLHISINLCGDTYTRSERICIEIIMSNPIKYFDMFALYNAVCDIAWCGVWTCGSSAMSYHMRSYPICVKCLWCTKKTNLESILCNALNHFLIEIYFSISGHWSSFWLLTTTNSFSFHFFFEIFFFQFSFLHCKHPKTTNKMYWGWKKKLNAHLLSINQIAE